MSERFKPIGFAAHTPKSGVASGPATSYAKYLSRPPLFAPESVEEQAPSRRKDRPRIRPTIERYDFPAITIGRRVDTAKIGSAWRQFEKRFAASHRGWNGGSLLPLSEVMCVFITPEQMNGALTEQYDGASRKPGDQQRRQIVTDIRNRVKSMVCDLATEQVYLDRQVGMQADTEELRARALDPDAYEIGYALEMPETDHVDRFWVPGRFELGDEEACGTHGYGLNFEDEFGILRRERETLIDRFCSQFRFNERHFRGDWQPQLQLVETVKPVHQIKQLFLPAAPISVPLKGPAAFVS